MKKGTSSLATLHRLLDLRLEQARLAIAAARRLAERKAETCQSVRQLRQAHVDEAAARLSPGFDPVRHRSAVEHLGVLARQQEAAGVDLRSAREALAEAGDSGLAADRRRAMVERVMERDQELRLAARARAESTEADQQWLLRQAAVSARRSREGDVA